jgi:SAM-dependent methyltransferase
MRAIPPPPETSSEFYQNLAVDSDYQKYCREFDRSIEGRYRKKANEILNHLSGRLELEDWHLLDLGCGRGAYGRLLVGEKGRVTGLDLNLTELSLAQEQSDGRQSYVLGNGYSLPFQSDTFNWVLCRHTLEHLSRPDDFLREILRVLRTNGFAYVSTPNLLSGVGFFLGLDGRKLFRRKLLKTDEGVYQIYTLPGLRNAALNAGFAGIQCLPLPGIGNRSGLKWVQMFRPSHKVLLIKNS